MGEDDAAPEAPSPMRMLVRGLVGHCPLCGGGHLFRRWFTMVERCPGCGFRFDRDPAEGFFLGAYTINLILVLTLLAADLMAYGLAVPHLIPGPPWAYLVAGVAICIGLPLLGYPPSKTTWSAIELAMHPPEPVEQAEAVAYLAARDRDAA